MRVCNHVSSTVAALLYNDAVTRHALAWKCINIVIAVLIAYSGEVAPSEDRYTNDTRYSKIVHIHVPWVFHTYDESWTVP